MFDITSEVGFRAGASRFQIQFTRCPAINRMQIPRVSDVIYPKKEAWITLFLGIEGNNLSIA